MIPATKSLLLSVVTGLLVTLTAAAQETLGPTELAGSYYAGHTYGGHGITLNGDGTYSDSSSSCTYTTKESGTFVVSDGVVRFKMLKYTGQQNGSEQEVDLFDNQARKTFWGSRDDDKVTPLVTEYALRPVKWGERIYLIYDDSVGYFANAINLGFEPRSDLISEPYFGSFYLREGDEKKRTSGIPSLPRQWQTLLLKKPLTVKVVSIVGEGTEKIALINKGSLAGLKVGMMFVSKNEEPTPWSMTEVISVEETFARVRVGSETKVGDKFTTKYKRKDYDK